MIIAASRSKIFSAVSIVICSVFLILCTVGFYPRYKQSAGNATLAWDAAGYYLYLPSVFIYHDLPTLEKTNVVIEKYQPGGSNIHDFVLPSDNGHPVFKYTSGMAVAELPFFLVAHTLAKLLNFPADGFSMPYQMAVQFGALLVSILGLWLLRKFLLYYYSDKVVALLLLIFAIGSNYLNYSSIDGSITHTWLFTLYAALLLCTRQFYKKPSFRYAIAVGALCGWAILIRPTELIACLIPILWGLENLAFQSLKQRFKFFLENKSKLLLAGLFAFLVAAIQAVYWKVVAGHWLVYSYGDQGFSWLHPHIFSYTFSYKSGWITYTPILIFALIGFIPFLKSGINRVMVVCFSAIAFYIVTAWDIWWYAGTGGRAMIQYYPILAIPLCSFLTWAGRLKIRKIILAPFLLLFAYVNIWFTYQAHGGGLYDAEGMMTREYYWRVVGRWNAPPEVLKLRDCRYLYEGAIPTTAKLIYSNSLRGKNAAGEDTVLKMYLPDQNSAILKIPISEKGYTWIRASAKFSNAAQEGVAWKMVQFIMSAWHGDEQIIETMLRPQRFLDAGDAKTISLDLRLPAKAQIDTLKIHFWNPGTDVATEIEDLKVVVF